MNSGLSIPRAGVVSLRFDRNVARKAANVAAILGLDNFKAFGNAIHMWVPSVRLRKPGYAGFSAIGTPKIFSPVVEDDHRSIMSPQREGSSPLSCHDQTDPVPSFVGRYPVWGQKRRFERRPATSGLSPPPDILSTLAYLKGAKERHRLDHDPPAQAAGIVN
jgi:hypothetical protein